MPRHVVDLLLGADRLRDVLMVRDPSAARQGLVVDLDRAPVGEKLLVAADTAGSGALNMLVPIFLHALRPLAGRDAIGDDLRQS